MDDHIIENLKQLLEEKEAILIQAAQYGKDLLDQNRDLSDALDECSTRFVQQIEILKEENYSITQKLDQKLRMEGEYLEEIEALKRHLASQRDEIRILSEFKDQTVLVSELKQRTRDIESMNDKLEMEKRHVTAYVAHVQQLHQDISGKYNALQASLNETASDEVAVLSNKITELETHKAALVNSLQEKENTVTSLQLQLDSWKCQVTSLQAELGEANAQLVTLCNSWQASAMENQELRAEMDVLRMHDKDHKKKGNSMFSELDDKRQEAERKLVALNVQHESLLNRYQLNQKQMQKLKVQMSMVLQMASGKVDSGHVQEMESQLAQSRSEVQALNIKLTELNRCKDETCGVLDSVVKLGSSSADLKTLQYIEAVIKKKDEEMSTLNEELEQRRLRSTYDARLLADSQQKLRCAEGQIHKLQSQKIKLSAQLDELKGQGGEQPTKAVLHRGRLEQVPGFNAEFSLGQQQTGLHDHPSELQKEDSVSALSSLQKDQTLSDITTNENISIRTEAAGLLLQQHKQITAQLHMKYSSPRHSIGSRSSEGEWWEDQVCYCTGECQIL